MTAYQTALPAMRAQITAQINGNGVACTVGRFNPSKDASGRLVGSYANVGSSETLWIQPYSISRGGSSLTQAQGVLGETTHIGYQVHGGATLIPKDRITASGETYVYDVVDQQIFDTHNELLLKQVRRS